MRRPFPSLISLCLLFCGVLLMAAGAAAQIVAADTMISSTYPASKYGSWTSLQVSATNESFVRFTFQNLPATLTADDVAKATLILYPNSVSGAGSLKVYRNPVPFEEATADYTLLHVSPRAEADLVAGPIAITAADATHPIAIDITAVVKDWLAGATNNGLALVPADTTINVRFDSKESTTTSHEPRLDIPFRGPKGDTGPSGPAGEGPPVGFSIVGTTPTPPSGYILGNTLEWMPLWQPWSAPPAGYPGMAVVETNGKIYAMGGGTGFSVSRHMYIFDLATGAWTQGPDMPDERMYAAAAARTDELGRTSIFLMGGFDSTGHVPSGNFTYREWEGRWLAGGPSGHLVCAGSAVLEGMYYFAGGCDQDTAANDLGRREIFRYDPGFNRWEHIGDLLRTRKAPAVAGFNGKLYILGGDFDDIRNPVGSAEVFDLQTHSRTLLSDWTVARAFMGGAEFDGKIYAFGGEIMYVDEFNRPHTEAVGTVTTYDPATGAWGSSTPMSAPRARFGYVKVGGKFFIVGYDFFDVFAPGKVLYLFTKQ